MATESVRVSPGMLPPSIRTTPNSPTVWAKASTNPVNTPGQASGSNRRERVRARETPRHHEASTSLRSTPAKAEVNGRTAKGKLNSTEPTSRPEKEKGKRGAKSASNERPTGLRGPKPIGK